MSFNNPEALLLLIPLALLLVKGRRGEALFFTAIEPLVRHIPSPSRFRRHFLGALFFLTASLMIITISDPLYAKIEWKKTRERLDILLALDLSESMSWSIYGNFKSENGDDSREKMAKEAVKEFIEKRFRRAALELNTSNLGERADRLGLIVFSSDAFVKYPPTTDYAILKNHIDEVSTSMSELGQDTELEKALLAAIILFNRSMLGMDEIAEMEYSLTNNVTEIYIPDSLKKRKDLGKGKVVVLFTDSKVDLEPVHMKPLVFNVGTDLRIIISRKLDLLKTLRMTKDLGIRVYLVSVGDFPEELQAAIEDTGGKAYNVKDMQSLPKIGEVYAEIDKLERAKVVDRELRREISSFFWFGIPAVVLLFIGELAGCTSYFRSIP